MITAKVGQVIAYPYKNGVNGALFDAHMSLLIKGAVSNSDVPSVKSATVVNTQLTAKGTWDPGDIGYLLSVSQETTSPGNPYSIDRSTTNVAINNYEKFLFLADDVPNENYISNTGASFNDNIAYIVEEAQ
jgi:hypothetical protein